MLLAIDTATSTPSVALWDENGIAAEMSWRTRENHTRSLMPQLTRLLELTGTDAAQLRAVAVATGPGSFTGLRIGLSAAKGLAYSLNATLIGVPTLEIAAAACVDALPICATLAAGRGRFAAALFVNENGAPRRVSAYFFGGAENIVAQLAQHNAARFIVAGELDATLRAQCAALFGERVAFAPDALNVRRAGFLAALAWQKFQAGYSDDVAALAPYYIPTAALA